ISNAFIASCSPSSAVDAASGALRSALGRQRAVGARLIDGSRQMLGQELERIVDRQAEMRRQLADLLTAECIAELIGADGLVLAMAEPRRDLVAQAALLELCDDPAQAAQIGLCQRGRDESRHGVGLALAQHPLEGVSDTVQKSHVILL